MGSNVIVGLDIGTASVKAVVAEDVGGRPALRGIVKEAAAGVRKGTVVDLAECSPAVARALAGVKKISKSGVRNVYVNIGTPQIRCQISRGIVAVSRADSEIYEDDIERVVKSSQAVGMGPNRMVLHNVTREYIVDGVGDIDDPLGLSGNRLEVSSLIIDAFSPHVKNLMRVVELAGARIGGVVLGPLSASRAALSKHQKDLGIVLVDIGAGTTGIAVYEEQKLAHIAILPVGAANITNDLAVGLKIPVEAAEAVKLHAGHAVPREVGAKDSVDLSAFAPDAAGAVSRRFVAEIIESRLAEIFELVNNELKSIGKNGELPGGAVLVGGGAKLPGATALAKQELKLSTQIGVSLREEWEGETAFAEVFEDPEFAGSLGLALWGAEQEGWRKKGSTFRVKNLLKYFLP